MSLDSEVRVRVCRKNFESGQERGHALSMSNPWPTELRLHKDRKILAVTFDNGASFELPAKYLRVRSPSAEVQGH